MTQLLDQAIREVTRLPAAEQDALAAILLTEMAAEQRWSTAFARSLDVLAELAEEALKEDQSGRTRPF